MVSDKANVRSTFIVFLNIGRCCNSAIITEVMRVTLNFVKDSRKLKTKLGEMLSKYAIESYKNLIQFSIFRDILIHLPKVNIWLDLPCV